MLNFLTQSEKGDFLDLMIAYAKNEEDPVIENKSVLNVFNFIRERLDTQIEKALIKAKVARENGVGGGRPSSKKKPKKTDGKPKITQSVIGQFESFWNLYDKKTGKPDAEKKFKAALKKDTFENIMAGLEKYIKARGSDAQYWKHPSTWLHNECWKDEYSAKQEQTPKPNQYTNPSYLDFLTGGK